MSDGSIVIDTRVDTSGIEEGVMQIQQALASMIEGAQSLSVALSSALSGAFAGGEGAGGSFLRGALDAAAADGPALVALIAETARQAVLAAEEAMNEGEGARIGGALIEGAQGGGGGASGALSSAAQGAAQGAVSAAAQTLSPSAGHSVGVQFGQGMASGIMSQSGAIAAAAQAAAQAALSAAMAALEIHSPSRAAYEMGRMFDLGFAEGIERQAHLAAQQADEMARAARDALSIAYAPQLSGGLGGGDVGRVDTGRGAGGFVIESIEIHAESLNAEQDFEKAGRALGEAFRREARYRGAL